MWIWIYHLPSRVDDRFLYTPDPSDIRVVHRYYLKYNCVLGLKMAANALCGKDGQSGQRNYKSVRTCSRWDKHHIKSDTGTISKVIQASYQKWKNWTVMWPTRAWGYKYSVGLPEDTSMWNFARTDRRLAPVTLYWNFVYLSLWRQRGLTAKCINLHVNNKAFSSGWKFTSFFYKIARNRNRS